MKIFSRIFFYIIFTKFAQNINLVYKLEPPQRGGSNEYPQSMFRIKNTKNSYTPVNPVLLYKRGAYGGYILYYIDMLS